MMFFPARGLVPLCLRGMSLAVLFLAGCASQHRTAPAAIDALEARAAIDHSLPRTLPDRAGWTTDLYAAFTVLGIAPSHENICAVVAVIEQESGFRVDPVIPHLPAIAWQEIDARAAHARVPRLVVHGVLQLKSPTGRSYGERIDHARTERELSDIYEDFIAAVPLGRTLFTDRNPIRTRGPMQVHIVFAEQFVASHQYPYPVQVSIADEVFTRRGGVYFGVAHLLAYTAPYDAYLYRFADFNAGQYASRDAAFQRAISYASGIPLTADGSLLPPDNEGRATGATELAARSLAARLGLSDTTIHEALAQGRKPEFERSRLYQQSFALAEQAERTTLPRAAIPQIDLHGPKITRKLTTEWYANRVDQRFEQCLKN